MSTSLNQPEPVSSWKQEVSRRIAAHKSRKNSSMDEPPAPAKPQPGASSLAAQAAARVAARYAQAPSYKQMQAAEAQAVLRAAEIATQRARKASVAVQVVVSDGGAAAIADPLPQEPEQAAEKSVVLKGHDFSRAESCLEPTRALAPEECFSAVSPEIPPFPAACEAPQIAALEQPEGLAPEALVMEPIVAPERPVEFPELQIAESESSSLHRQADFTLSSPAEPPAPRAAASYASSAADRWELPKMEEDPWGNEALEPVEPDMPIHANLIEFPHELVAAHKIRPRRAEGPFAEMEAEPPLSIFEVDPEAIPTAHETSDGQPAVAWSRPEWSDIELEAQTPVEEEPEEVLPSQPALHLAPTGQRLLAALVDGALITGAFLVAALMVLTNMQHLPAAKVTELAGVSVLLLVALLYQTLFLTLTDATPGMRYARISLCTFDGQIPSRAQLRNRLGALLLSVLPVGLGVAWVLFDDDHLSWHDQLSRTYLRRC